MRDWRHQLETAAVVLLLVGILGVAFLVVDPAADPSARATLVVACLALCGWVVYERELS